MVFSRVFICRALAKSRAPTSPIRFPVMSKVCRLWFEPRAFITLLISDLSLQSKEKETFVLLISYICGEKQFIKNKLGSIFKLQGWAKFLNLKFSLWSEINETLWVQTRACKRWILQEILWAMLVPNFWPKISENVQSLQALVRTQSVYNIIDFRLEFAI